MAREPIDIIVRQRGARKTGAAIAGVGTQAATANKALKLMQGTMLTLGIGLGLAASIRTIAEFSQEMSTVKAITGATEQQFFELRNEAKLLGSTTRFSASEAAEAMVFLARAGFDTDQVMKSISGTLDLAQAGALGLGEAADIASNVLTGFRISIEETGRVVDVLALAANSGNTTVSQLGQAMKFVGPVAAGLGISLEVATAAATALSDAGLQASLAGTGLRKVLSELESPSVKTAKLLRDIGLSADEVKISNVGLVRALELLKEAGIDTGLALEIFGDRGGPAFEVLSTSIPKVKRLAEELNNADGTARRIAKTMDDNLKGALLATRSAVEALVLGFGDLGAQSFLTKFFFDLADSIRGVANNLDKVLGVALALIPTLVVLFGPAILAGMARLTAATLLWAKSIIFADLAVSSLIFPLGILKAVLLSMALSGGALFLFRDQLKLTEEGLASLGDFFVAFKNKAAPAFEEFMELNRGAIFLLRGMITDLELDWILSMKGIILATARFVDATGVLLDIAADTFRNFFDGVFSGMDALGSLLTAQPALAKRQFESSKESFALLGGSIAAAFFVGMLNISKDGAVAFVNQVFDDAEATARRRQQEPQLRAILSSVRIPGFNMKFGDSVQETKQLTEAQLAQMMAAGDAEAVNATLTAQVNQLRRALDPAREAMMKLAETENILDKGRIAGIISQEEQINLLARQRTQLEDILTPMKSINAELDQQFKLLGMTIEQREVETQVNAFVLDQIRKLQPLGKEEITQLRERLTLLQASNVQTAIRDSLTARFITSQKMLVRTISEVNLAMENNVISTEQGTRAILEAEVAAGQASGTFGGQLRASVSELRLEFMNFGTEVGDTIKNAFSKAEDALVSFVQTGKLDFKSLIDSMIADLIRLALRQTIIKAAATVIGAGFSQGGVVQILETGGVVRRLAMGGVVNGAQKLAVGGVINSPILFETKEGSAIAGEAGREAILPTVRDSGLATVLGTTGTRQVEVPLSRQGGILGVDLSRFFGPNQKFAMGGLTSSGTMSSPIHNTNTGSRSIVFAPKVSVTVEGGGEPAQAQENGEIVAEELGRQLKRSMDEFMMKFAVDQLRQGGIFNSSGRSMG